MLSRLRQLIRDVPDHPRPGIVFKDITPMLGDAAAFDLACREMAGPFVAAGITHVVAIESRGFLFGGAIARALGAGLVPVRKPGKLPGVRATESYELEYGTDALEMHVDAVGPGSSVLIVDDVLATGGTAAATGRLVTRHGAIVAGYSFLIELGFLGGRTRVPGVPVHRVLEY